MTHKAYGKHSEEAIRAVCNEAQRLEKLLSCFVAGSDVCRVNMSAGMKDERLSSDTYDVLSKAIKYSRHCQGLFDVTIGPLVRLWSSRRNTLEPPEESSINQIIPLVSYSDLLLNPYEKSAKLRKQGQSIDLGGVGKGFAGDKFLEVFKKHDIKSAFTNIGGNVAALGAKPDGSPWSVGIQHPRQEKAIVGVVSIVDKAVVTSGDYQRYFIGSNSKRYHHILNPTTGYPAESGLTSVTVVAESSVEADALSTILFVAGMEKGLVFLRQLSGIEAVFVDIASKVHITGGLKKFFKAADGIDVNFLD